MMGVTEWVALILLLVIIVACVLCVVALPFLLLIGCINVANSISGEPRLWPPEDREGDHEM